MTWKKVLKFLKFWNHIQQIWWRLENRAKNWKGCKWSNVHHQHSSCSSLNRLTTDLPRKPLEVPKLECKLVKMRKVYEWMLKIVKHVRSIPPHRALEFKTYIAVDMIYLFSFRNSWVGNGWLSMLEHMDIKMIRTFGRGGHQNWILDWSRRDSQEWIFNMQELQNWFQIFCRSNGL